MNNNIQKPLLVTNSCILVVYAVIAVVESTSKRRRLAEKQLNNSHDDGARPPGSQQLQPHDGAGRGYKHPIGIITRSLVKFTKIILDIIMAM